MKSQMFVAFFGVFDGIYALPERCSGERRVCNFVPWGFGASAEAGERCSGDKSA